MRRLWICEIYCCAENCRVPQAVVKSGDGGERGGGGNERWFEKDGSGGGSTAEGQAAGLDATLAGFVVPPQKQLRLQDSK